MPSAGRLSAGPVRHRRLPSSPGRAPSLEEAMLRRLFHRTISWRLPWRKRCSAGNSVGPLRWSNHSRSLAAGTRSLGAIILDHSESYVALGLLAGEAFFFSRKNQTHPPLPPASNSATHSQFGSPATSIGKLEVASSCCFPAEVSSLNCSR